MSLADDWGPFGITVNCLAPGWFNTPQTAILYDNPEWVASTTARIPAGRTGLPHDMDGAVVFKHAVIAFGDIIEHTLRRHHDLSPTTILRELAWPKNTM